MSAFVAGSKSIVAAASQPPALQVDLLGQVRIAHEGRVLSALARPRLQSLLAYLILQAGAPASRRQLAYLFWPDSDEAQARTNLRRELHHLRRALPQADVYLEIGAQAVSWRPTAPFALDVAAFRDELARAERVESAEAARAALVRAISLYRGELLVDCDDLWIDEPRAQLGREYRAALERLVAELEAAREYAEAAGYARRLVQHDPLHEPSYGRLIRLLALCDDRAGALQAYRECRRILHEELGVAPSAELEVQHERLVAGSERATERASPAGAALVGRRREWETLLAAWKEAAEGEPRLLVITGEAGIGKTRLAEALLDWASPQGIVVARSRAYAAEGRLAYAPISDWLRSPAFKPGLERLDAVWASEAARLLPEVFPRPPEASPGAVSSAAWQRRRLFEALARAVLLAPAPRLLLLDDLQWCDRETLEWLHFLLRFEAAERLLVIGTVRSEEAESNRALVALLHDLSASGRSRSLPLGPLSAGESAELATAVAGRTLGAAERARLFAESEGHPLFVVEMARAGHVWGEGGAASAAAERSASDTLPPKVHALIVSRLAQLSPAASELTGLAATIGRSFGFDVLRGASDLAEAALVEALDELGRRRILREQGDAYDFGHDRIREVAYAELSAARRRLHHGRVAEALRSVHGEALDGVSAALAAHYAQVGEPMQAVHFYRRAARVAAAVLAHDEAVRLLRQALEELNAGPPGSERDRTELTLQLERSASLNVIQGYASPELEASLERMRRLGADLQEPQSVVRSLNGLLSVYFVRGDIAGAHAAAQQSLALAEREGVPSLLADSHFFLAGMLFTMGRPAPAHNHFELARVLADPERPHATVLGTNLLVFSQSWEAHALWALGDDAAARERTAAALGLAERLAHPHSQALAHAYAALVAQMQADYEGSLFHADTARALCNRYGIAYYDEWGTIIRGWVRATWDRLAAGIAEIRLGLENLRGQRAEVRRPYYLSLLAEAYLAHGRTEEAGATLDAAMSTANQRRELWWLPELHRLRSLTVSPGEGEAHLRLALRLANKQGNVALARGAAEDLARITGSNL